MSADRSPLVVGGVEYNFKVLDPDLETSVGWAHHGIAVLGDGSIVAAAPDDASLLRLDPTGRERDRVGTELVEMHGITALQSTSDVIWVADNGEKATPGRPSYGRLARRGRVVALGLDGIVRQEIVVPEIDAYATEAWKPCAVAVDEEGLGGSGDVWVVDGYGQSLLHRFSREGRCLATVDGSESGTCFSTPHDLLIDRRRGFPEIYVADRSNARLVVLDLKGRLLRVAGEGVLSSPSGLATSGSLLFVAELRGRLAVLDATDRLVGYLGASDAPERLGWPNALNDRGDTIRVPDLTAGSFNSPHGIDTDRAGAVYVSEWLVGGRIVRLTPAY